jgi:type II secretion system protein I
MKKPNRNLWHGERGMTVIEVMVALLVFTVAIMTLASTGFVASQALRSARSYMAASTVAQSKLDSLSAIGWHGLATASGAEVVRGYPVTWTVQGTNPKKVTVVVKRILNTAVYADTFVTYVGN